MSEEIEVPTEHLHEAMHEKAHEEGGFSLQVALTSALIAALAAVCALFSSSFADEAMMSRVKASDQWAYYQAKSIKASVLSSKLDLLASLKHKPDDKDLAKVDEYKKDMEEITKEAKNLEQESEEYARRNALLAKGVTLFQVAIALSAIAVLTKRRFLWGGGLLLGIGGTVFLFLGLH
jgi:hypothetical protein